MQHACAIMSSVHGPGSTVFFHIISRKARFSEKKNAIEYKMCFDFLYNFEPLLILRKTERDIIKNVLLSECKIPFILVRFLLNLNFLVCFLLGNSPASEIYMPTFRDTLSVPSS